MMKLFRSNWLQGLLVFTISFGISQPMQLLAQPDLSPLSFPLPPSSGQVLDPWKLHKGTLVPTADQPSEKEKIAVISEEDKEQAKQLARDIWVLLKQISDTTSKVLGKTVWAGTVFTTKFTAWLIANWVSILQLAVTLTVLLFTINIAGAAAGTLRSSVQNAQNIYSATAKSWDNIKWLFGQAG